MGAASSSARDHSTIPLSGYLYRRAPEKYGGQQEDYLASSAQVIAQGLNLLKTRQREGGDPTTIFLELYPLYQMARHDIALRHDTNDKELFGSSRTIAIASEWRAATYTPLTDPYEEYTAIFMSYLHPMLSTLARTSSGFLEKKGKVKERVLNRFFSFEFEFTEQKDGPDWAKPKSEEWFEQQLETHEDFLVIQRTPSLMGRLKREHSRVYKALKDYMLISTLNRIFPEAYRDKYGRVAFIQSHHKTGYLFGTLRLEIEGKMYAIGQYLTWFDSSGGHDPVDHMRDYSKIIAVHQDPFLIDQTLQEIGRIFATAIQWDKETQGIRDLKDQVALLRFLFAHCMPSHRGDGAIGDWLELTIYHYHGFLNTSFNDDTLPCIEALATPLFSQYRARYDALIDIK